MAYFPSRRRRRSGKRPRFSCDMNFPTEPSVPNLLDDPNPIGRVQALGDEDL